MFESRIKQRNQTKYPVWPTKVPSPKENRHECVPFRVARRPQHSGKRDIAQISPEPEQPAESVQYRRRPLAWAFWRLLTGFFHCFSASWSILTKQCTRRLRGRSYLPARYPRNLQHRRIRWEPPSARIRLIRDCFSPEPERVAARRASGLFHQRRGRRTGSEDLLRPV